MENVLHLLFDSKQRRQYTAFNKAQELVDNNNKKTFCYNKICFREIFFLASQWKLKGSYRSYGKALSAYRIVPMIRKELNDVPEIFLHDYNIVDVSKEIEYCMLNSTKDCCCSLL